MILEVLSKIGFDWRLALANTVNFVVIFFILKKYFFKPISDSIEARKKKVDDSASSTKMAEEKLQEAMKERDQIIIDAHKKAKHLTDKAEEKGEEILTHFKTEATKEKEKIVQAGKDDIDRREKEARVRIQEESSDLIILGAQKLIREDLGDEIKSSFARKISSS